MTMACPFRSQRPARRLLTTLAFFLATAGALAGLRPAAAWADANHPSAGVDYAKLQQQLQTVGLTGWIHAAVPAQGLYIFTWRDPTDFFTSAEFPIVSHVPGVMDQLASLHRNDKVLIRGDYLNNGAPQRHIYATELTLLTAFPGTPPTPYAYTVKLPDDLQRGHDLIAKVHAVDADGKVLVIEYKDVVLPVFVDLPAVQTQIKDYYRGDKIRLHYVLRAYPTQPSHLSPDPAAAQAVEFLASASATNGSSAELVGNLVMFPKSPEIAFDVFALQYTDADGVTYVYTLVNLDDPGIFQAIRDKAAAVFNANSMHAVNGRNKVLLPNVTVHASGTINVVSPSQANPQILLATPDALTFQAQ